MAQNKQSQKIIGPKILGIFLIAVGVISLVGFGSFVHLACFKDNSGWLTCTSHITWFGFVPLGFEQLIEGVVSATTETNCITEGTTNTERCTENKLVLISPSDKLTIGPGFLNEITAYQASFQINQMIRDPDSPSINIDYKNLANVIMGTLFVALPFLVLGVMLVYGFFQKIT